MATLNDLVNKCPSVEVKLSAIYKGGKLRIKTSIFTDKGNEEFVYITSKNEGSLSKIVKMCIDATTAKYKEFN